MAGPVVYSTARVNASHSISHSILMDTDKVVLMSARDSMAAELI